MYKKTLCAELHEAFCRGEAINPAEFAAARRVKRQSINSALKHFGDLVKQRQGDGYSKRHSEWVCVDRERMLRFVPPTSANQQRKAVKEAAQETVRTVAFEPLLAAWGMLTRPVEIHLPKTVHFMVDDQPASCA